MLEIQIYTDGGARGNPGLAACAFVAKSGRKILHKDSKNLGVATNNVAEYNGVLSALHWSIKETSLKISKIDFYLDSELVVKQLNGVYKIKDPNLKILFGTVKEILQKSQIDCSFTHIPREQNKMADELVNFEMDKVG